MPSPPAFSGPRLVQARLAAGLLQRQVAEQCTAMGEKVDQSQISQWEAGRSAPLPPKLPVLAAVLGCSVNDLYVGAQSSEMAS